MNASQFQARIITLLKNIQVDCIQKSVAEINSLKLPKNMDGFEDLYWKCKVMVSILNRISYVDYQSFSIAEKILFGAIYNGNFEQDLDAQGVNGLEEVIERSETIAGLDLARELEEYATTCPYEPFEENHPIFHRLKIPVQNYIQFYEQKKFQRDKWIEILASEDLRPYEMSLGEMDVNQETDATLQGVGAIGTTGLLQCVSIVTTSKENIRVAHVSGNYLDAYLEAAQLPKLEEIYVVGGTVETLDDQIALIMTIMESDKAHLLKDIYLCSSSGWRSASCVVQREVADAPCKVFAGFTTLSPQCDYNPEESSEVEELKKQELYTKYTLEATIFAPTKPYPFEGKTTLAPPEKRRKLEDTEASPDNNLALRPS